MKKIGFMAVLVFLLIAIGGYATAQGTVTIYHEDLYDSNGDKYGANFFVDSTVNEEIYVSPYIVSQDNVWGNVVSTILLQANEKHVNIGNFNQRDRTKAWSVTINAKWIEVSKYHP